MERNYNEDRLSAYFDGELSLNERSEMEALLRASPEMRRTLDDFQRQRDWLATMPRPALSAGFTGRVMDQVLAAANVAAPAIPPPFPVRPKRRSLAIVSTIALSIAAMIVVGFFLANQPKRTGGDTVATADQPEAVVTPSNDSPSSAPDTKLPETKIDSPNNGAAIAASEPKINEEANPAANKVPEADPPATNIVEKGSSDIPLIASSEPKKAVTNASSESTSGNNTLAANTPKANPKATMKTRPKAYRVQIGAFSEFEARLKDAGVPFYHGKLINPPSDATRALRDTIPDPEYVLVEGSEEQLGDLVKKLQSQADLAMSELIEDLEAQFLLQALANIDQSGVSIRPEEAKEEEMAGYHFSMKALRTLIPPEAPTRGPNRVNSNPAPRVQIKPLEDTREILYVPRVIFILDVRIGEAQGKPGK